MRFEANRSKSRSETCSKKKQHADSVWSTSSQAELKRMVTIAVEKKNKRKFNLKSGWYTEREMKETLKMTKWGP